MRDGTARVLCWLLFGFCGAQLAINAAQTRSVEELTARTERLEERAAQQHQRIADLQTRLVVDALRRGEPAVFENAWGPDGK